MYTIACRTKNIVMLFASVLVLYSASFSVVAQDKGKEVNISSYKVKLSLSNLPLTIITPYNITNTGVTTIKYLEHQQASLKISPVEKQNLLVAYLDGGLKSSSEISNNKFLNLISSINDTTDPIAYG